MAKQLTMHPAPVYVATFADGTVARMSYWQPLNKPLRQDAARAMVCQAIGNERAFLAAGDACGGPKLRKAAAGLWGAAKWPTRRDFDYERRNEPKPEVAGSYYPMHYSGEKLSYRSWWFRTHPPIGMRGSLVDRGLASYQTAGAARRAFALGEIRPSTAADIIAGHTERKDTGEIIPDPFFEESTVTPIGKPARKPAATKAQLDRAVALLAELESRFGSQFPAAFGEAQEFLLERMAA